jgi:hypothetical protein
MLCSTVRAGSYESWERQALYDENPVQRARVVGWLASREPALLWVHLFCRCDVTWLADSTHGTYPFLCRLQTMEMDQNPALPPE